MQWSRLPSCRRHHDQELAAWSGPAAGSGVIDRRLLQHDTLASRRALLRGLACSASALALGGCVGVSAGGVRFDASSLSTDPTLVVATTRKRVNGARAKPSFGPERAAMTVARAKLKSPSDSRFSLAAVGLDDWRLDAVEPVSGEVGDLLAQGGGSDVLIYVHGFKTHSRWRRSMPCSSPTA